MGAKCRIGLGAADPNQTVKLFAVYNTSHNSLYVLAPDLKAAMSIAHSANHIHGVFDRKDRTYPHGQEVRAPFGEQMAASWGLVELAIERRLQGTVHFDGAEVWVGKEVIKE
ncbi:hypothetical protein [Sphingopyxis witflariensis]|uniref:Uncharacterized protein n=1 Tax=Sphingopyxis witflariensis TaxID=173675 RepID=A0A246K5X3_9SPHN|nr:hypothetical protein [Sphingopyxis witflariensis]OWR01421.1 hypothetical protein CDQ91_03225 [Sphingopyxis witflariensis]